MPANHGPAPGFTLPALNGTEHALAEYSGRVVVINFWSAECPWARRADTALVAYRTGWGERVVVLPVASNANETPEEMTREAAERALPFVLHDANRRVADLYGVQTTPHFFVVDSNGVLRYQGALDDVTFRKREPERFYLQEAVQALLEGKNPETETTGPYGCSLVRYRE